MNDVDGRTIAVGIVVGTILGFVLYAVTQNTIWIYLGAALGIILAMGLNKYKGPGDDE